MEKSIRAGTLALRSYILKNKYRGYDRYDGLESPILKLPLFKHRKIRFIAQQLVKRSPLNIRPLLGIPKGLNPVTLALCLQGNSYLMKAVPGLKDALEEENDFLLTEINRLSSKGYSGMCWGYDFDWESRYATIPAFTPTVVATGIVTNALFEHSMLCADDRSSKMVLDAVPFILNDLNRIADKDTFCFSYSPRDRQIVFNATMKGARLLAQGFYLSGKKEWLETAGQTVLFVMNNQRADGAWVYAHKDARAWVDNYHTGYILDSLREYIRCSGDKTFQPALEKGLDFYVSNFFEDNTLPKLYDKKTYPIDSTSAAQSIITLVNFAYTEIAANVALWVVNNFQGGDGHIYFRKYKNHFISKVSFMRWSNAWMYVALSKLLAALPEQE